MANFGPLHDTEPTLPSAWRRGALRPLVLGHRGARHAAPENTLEAFALAREEGAEGTELDVQLSADGEIFVVHDLDLKRVTEARHEGLVAQLSAAELSQVRLAAQTRIPRLSEVLDWALRHDQLLNIELKSGQPRTDAIAHRVAALLERYPAAAECVVVSSFHPWLLGQFRLRTPKICSGLILSARHPRLLGAAWSRLLGCQTLHPQASALLSRPGFAQSALPLNTWTVNDPAQARALAEQGVNALISDCPGRILQALAAAV